MTKSGDELLAFDYDGDTIVASGEIDAHSAPALATVLEAAVPNARLDLSRIEFVDSSGLRILVDVHQRCLANGGALTIVAPSQPVRRLFAISELDDYLNVE